MVFKLGEGVTPSLAARRRVTLDVAGAAGVVLGGAFARDADVDVVADVGMVIV